MSPTARGTAAWVAFGGIIHYNSTPRQEKNLAALPPEADIAALLAGDFLAAFFTGAFLAVFLGAFLAGAFLATFLVVFFGIVVNEFGFEVWD